MQGIGKRARGKETSGKNPSAHAYCLSYRFLYNVVMTTVIEMVEMVEILNGDLVSVQLSE